METPVLWCGDECACQPLRNESSAANSSFFASGSSLNQGLESLRNRQSKANTKVQKQAFGGRLRGSFRSCLRKLGSLMPCLDMPGHCGRLIGVKAMHFFPEDRSNHGTRVMPVVPTSPSVTPTATATSSGLLEGQCAISRDSSAGGAALSTPDSSLSSPDGEALDACPSMTRRIDNAKRQQQHHGANQEYIDMHGSACGCGCNSLGRGYQSSHGSYKEDGHSIGSSMCKLAAPAWSDRRKGYCSMWNRSGSRSRGGASSTAIAAATRAAIANSGSGNPCVAATGSLGGGGAWATHHPCRAERALQAAQVRASQPITVQHNVKVIGSGSQWIIFAHAFGDNQQVWMPIINDLDHSQYSIILYDLSGARGTDYDAFDGQQYGTLHGHVDDLIGIIDHVRKQQHIAALKFTFVGHRQAGMIGMLASLRCPDAFERLVLISSSPRLLNDDGYEGGFSLQDVAKTLGFMESNAELWRRGCQVVFCADDLREERLRQLTKRLFLLRPDVAFSLLRTTFMLDLRDVLPQVKTPVNVIVCEADTSMSLATAKYMTKKLKTCELTHVEYGDVMESPEALTSSIMRAIT